jgi:hypothetical protein
MPFIKKQKNFYKTLNEKISKFFFKTKIKIKPRKIKQGYNARIKNNNETSESTTKRQGPVIVQNNRFHTEKDLIHYVKNIVASSSNGKPLNVKDKNFIKGRLIRIA